MVAEQSTVRAGGEIDYRMIIRNVGSENFELGTFVLEWHTPLGTVASATGPCDSVPIDELQTLCERSVIPQPGFGEASHEQRNSRGLVTIRAGQAWVQEWHVQTAPVVPAGTEYITHAHLRVTVGGQEQIITTDTVTVTVGE